MRTALFAACWLTAGVALAQPYGEPDRGEPADAMIQEYLQVQAAAIHDSFGADLESLEAWQGRRERYREEYFYMLGLWPLPEKTPLEATVTGTLEGDGFVVDMLHYQSRPGLYVTGNLYRPPHVAAGERLPAVFYVCGHSSRGRDGNKTAFQSHGIWFARHGYICLIVDTLQLGEIAALHHGTYRENRWWWHSRGYTPAGVECWNGVRGIDYLVSRPDVDPQRIAVTGISGGGAATFWIAAADERVRVAVPVSGMADLPSYVPNRVINGHCDCMFLYNTFQWPWTRIAALVAPRPQLFVNSDHDRIFPMDANERVINRLERVYSLYGASDQVEAVVSIGGHAYREDIRKAVFRYINLQLKNDPSQVTDSEVDLVADARDDRRHPIEPEKLRVFPTDADIPAGELNTTIDEHFVPIAEVPLPAEGQFDDWRERLLSELRRVSFRNLPARIPAAQPVVTDSPDVVRLKTEPGIVVSARSAAKPDKVNRVVLLVSTSDASGGSLPDWLPQYLEPGDEVVTCHTRGVGPSRWTQKNPPNYVRRSHILLGRTEDEGRVRDVAAAARYLRAKYDVPVLVAGQNDSGIVAAYAALWEPDIEAVLLHRPPATHQGDGAPVLLNVLRVCDIPDVVGMLAPRRVTLSGAPDALADRAAQIFQIAGATQQLVRK